MGIDTAAQIAVACHDAGVTPIVRVPGYEHYLATRLLDAGAMGIVFPHVDTAEHARQLVDNCKYPPMGHRSLGGPMAQLGFRAVPRAESTEVVNRETIMVMLDAEVIDNADAIAAVPGATRVAYRHQRPHARDGHRGQVRGRARRGLPEGSRRRAGSTRAWAASTHPNMGAIKMGARLCSAAPTCRS